MAKITLTAFAEMHNEHRQQVTRLRRAGRIVPIPTLGTSKTGRICYLVDADARILTLHESRKNAKNADSLKHL